MITKLYTIRDRKSGIYGTPFGSFNDDTAIRDFKGFCNQAQNVYLADDLELYYVGYFESDTGEVLGSDKPEFLFSSVRGDADNE